MLAVRSKAYAWSLSIARIAGSNTAGGMDVRFWSLSCVVYVAVSAKRSLGQRSHNAGAVSVCDVETSKMKWPGP
jgi:hypothetical protein